MSRTLYGVDVGALRTSLCKTNRHEHYSMPLHAIQALHVTLHLVPSVNLVSASLKLSLRLSSTLQTNQTLANLNFCSPFLCG